MSFAIPEIKKTPPAQAADMAITCRLLISLLSLFWSFGQLRRAVVLGRVLLEAREAGT
jgi:hypothetical protein